MISCMLTTYFAFSQGQNDTILIDKDLQEVIISATKTTQTITQLPIPVVIISENEIKNFCSSKLLLLVSLYQLK